jgi:hypothetical protein
MLQIHPNTKTLKLKHYSVLYMKGINPHDEVKGSNPSPGAYYEGASEYHKADDKKKRRLRI